MRPKISCKQTGGYGIRPYRHTAIRDQQTNNEQIPKSDPTRRGDLWSPAGDRRSPLRQKQSTGTTHKFQNFIHPCRLPSPRASALTLRFASVTDRRPRRSAIHDQQTNNAPNGRIWNPPLQDYIHPNGRSLPPDPRKFFRQELTLRRINVIMCNRKASL